ncbi:MAG: hypothetical protein E4H37_05405 [Gemmatimonadales bacterium]|nr:MAG: hypothetical protein E4H37_05405 [Gemmatimonadales bacterium]
MLRNLVGYAVFAVVALFLVKVAFGLLGIVWSLFWTVVVFAAIGFVFYFILRLISPRSADKVDDMIKGKKSA